MKRYLIYMAAILLTAMAGTAHAQKKFSFDLKEHNIEFEVKAAFSIGGTSPLPLPEEIRSIKGYNPTLALSLGAQVTKWFDNSKWGFSSGISFDNKAMKTKADVKSYKMEINYGKGPIKGYWTGMVQTTVDNSYFTIPFLAAYKFTPSWNLRFGPYVAFLIDKGFSGYVYDGYLRQDDPTGPKVTIDSDQTASYNFSSDLNKFQYGLQAGGSWKMNRHFRVFGDLQWGLNDVFKSDFETISFNMYNIYLNMGFGYIF